MTKSMKLSTVVRRLRKLDENKYDEVIFAKSGCWFDDLSARLVMRGNLFKDSETHYDMTDWSLRQACLKVGTLPPSYAAACPPNLRATNLNYWRKLLPDDRKWFLRFNEGRCRAVLGEVYSPLANSDLAENILERFGDGYEIVRPYIDSDTMHLRFKQMADPKDKNYAYGVYVGNGEIGNRSLTIAGFVQRHSCENSIIITDSNWRFRHVGFTRTEYIVMVGTLVAQALQLAVDQREKIAQAELEKIEDFSDTIARICKANGLNQETRDKVLIGSEGQQTLMGVVNGLSWAAHQQENVELQVDMETLAGQFLAHGLKALPRQQKMAYATLEVAQEEEI